MNKHVDLPGIHNITVSGRIGSGTTTLAVGLTKTLGWKLLEGGALFEKIHKDLKVSELEVNSRPDKFDLRYEEKIKKILSTEKYQIIQSHLAGFNAQGVKGIFKILIVCEGSEGNDKTEIRIDRLINRRRVSVEEAKEEVFVRELRNLSKWRRLYANNNKNWVYWDKKYYDLIISTYRHNQEETLKIALDALRYR